MGIYVDIKNDRIIRHHRARRNFRMLSALPMVAQGWFSMAINTRHAQPRSIRLAINAAPYRQRPGLCRLWWRLCSDRIGLAQIRGWG